MNFEKFEKDMVAFTFGQHQDALTYLAQLKIKDWTVKDVEEWMAKEKKRLAQRQRNYKVVTKECPLCLASMSLLSLNFNRATVTGENSQSVWFCSNQKCLNTIYNKESVKELRSEGG